MDENILFEKIMLRIEGEKKMMAVRRKIAIFSVVLACSLLGLVPATKAVVSGFANSGFVQLFSLVFSDTEIVMGLWQNFALSLLETLPVNGILIAGFLTFAFLGSLRFLSKNIKGFYNKQQLINV